MPARTGRDDAAIRARAVMERCDALATFSEEPDRLTRGYGTDASRRAQDATAAWLRAAGIGYRWEERLGGRRRLPPGEPVADGWWTVAQFAAYAAHTRTPEFAAALDEVLAEAREGVVAVMCSEYVWWRCHRRLIADVAVLGRGVPVRHLMPDGRTADHRPSEGAVLDGDGTLRWP